MNTVPSLKQHPVSHGTFAAPCLKPTFFPEVIDRIAEGASALQVCKDYGIKYSDLLRYMHSDPVRDREFTEACKAGESWLVYRLSDELRNIGLHDISEALQSDGTVKPIEQIPEPLRRTIASIEVAELFEGVGSDRKAVGVLKTIKLIEKTKAIDMLLKKLGQYIDKVVVSGGVTVTHSVDQADLDSRLEMLLARKRKPDASLPPPSADVTEAELVTKPGSDI